MISRQIRLLFLTTQRPETIKAEWPYYQNWTLPKRMAELGVAVEQLCWRDPCITIDQLIYFDRVCFLWCNNYHEHGIEFQTFLKEKLRPAQMQAHQKMQIINPLDFVLWNMDKAIYLPELEAHGFLLPRTAHIDLPTPTTASPNNLQKSLDDLVHKIRRAASDKNLGTKFVLKPAISGSSKLTHLVQDINNLSSTEDTEYLSSLLLTPGLEGSSLIVQTFEPAIADGEYSLVFIAGEHTHTMLKTPAKGEFKCQAEFGGAIAELAVENTPPEAVAAARGIMAWLSKRFQLEEGTSNTAVPYCRIDGVLKDGQFVLMEVEGIEPHLWLETCADATVCERLYGVLLS